jgi:hypothetical protein
MAYMSAFKTYDDSTLHGCDAQVDEEASEYSGNPWSEPTPWVIGALENEQDDRVKVNGLFGSLNDWKG